MVEIVLSGYLLFDHSGPRRHRDFIKRKHFVIGLFVAPLLNRYLFKMAADFAFPRLSALKPNIINASFGRLVKCFDCFSIFDIFVNPSIIETESNLEKHPALRD